MERKPYNAKAAKAQAIATGDNFYMNADGIFLCIWCNGKITIPPSAGNHFREPPYCPQCAKKKTVLQITQHGIQRR